MPASIRVALTAAALVGIGALVLLAGAFAIGRWTSAAWTAAWVLAAGWFVRATLRHDRRARRTALPVAAALAVVLLSVLATKLAILVRDDRGDAGEALVMAGAAAPFVALALALFRRSAAAWFAPRI